MDVEVKICGLKRPGDVKAALDAGAAYVGFVLFPPSPRHIDLTDLARLAAGAHTRARRVGVFVNPDDDLLAAAAPYLDMFQLHGDEAPGRLADIKARFAKPVIKALKVAERSDLGRIEVFDGIADRFLFDARPPHGSAVPGGHGRPFDWTLLAQVSISRPWFLSGGLTVDNVRAAIAQSDAPAVDVSSGVEVDRGVKSADRIAAFIERARHIEDATTMDSESDA